MENTKIPYIFKIQMKATELIILTGNVVEENAPGVGGWGGTCKCPDGNAYQVGDNNDSCASLACKNGQMVKCNRHNGPWSRRKVTCAL